MGNVGDSGMQKTPETKTRLNRRTFIGTMWAVSLVGLFGQAGTALLDYLKPRTSENGFGSKVIAGRPKEFKVGTVSLITKGHFYVSRVEDGYLAIYQRCTHLGCTVPWRTDEKQFHCPCHSSLFNNKGEVTGGPAPRPLDLFPIEVIDGNLVVDTSSPISRDKYDPSQAKRV
jgi:cytochrome b6-f complex iron-sulfur subunit